VNAKAPRRAAGVALYADCGDLVVAFSIEEIVRVFLAEGAVFAPIAPATGMGSVAFESERIPAWDLGYLLGLRKMSTARTWIVLTSSVDGKQRQFAISCDRSLAVRPRQFELALPARLFTSRPGAIVGVFTTESMGGDGELAPTGFAISAAHLLLSDELQAISAAASEGKLSW
jgi:hypothetical protein